ncbi:Zn-dependent M32 family carboxypeptidase [Paenibacillus sp. W4I10]|nr:Zn-dependent M32 family carboxypeptidase [Paenibacillus sp. W4I10]
MYARNSNIGARCITLLFEGFTSEELEQQSRFYERVVANLEGFSDTVLELAENNGIQEHDRSSTSNLEQKQRDNTGKSNYLSY